MIKYYISFAIQEIKNTNNISVIGQQNDDNTIYGDIFINVDKYIDEEIIKKIKDSIRKNYKLSKNSNIVFINITDLTERKFDESPFRGSETLPKENDNKDFEEMEKIIRENIVEISNDVKMDPTEVFFNN
jgi:hypothetical protein